VVIAGNKSGYLYVLNRDTGVPVFAVHEQPVPKSDVPEEVASPTQPVPVELRRPSYHNRSLGLGALRPQSTKRAVNNCRVYVPKAFSHHPAFKELWRYLEISAV